jgi:hypothetical protein
VNNTAGLLVLWFCIASTSVSAQIASTDPTTTCRSGVYKFKGKALRGQTYSRKFGGFVFTLQPGARGDWHIDISQKQHHGIDGLTGPMHFVPKATDIEGWHIRNAANTGPNTGDVNAPDETRHFLFSPHWPRCKESDLTSDGQGTLEITDMELGNLVPGEKATMTMMEFTVTLRVGVSACKAACPGTTTH